MRALVVDNGMVFTAKPGDAPFRDGDLFATPPERIPEIGVAATIVGGEVAFERIAQPASGA